MIQTIIVDLVGVFIHVNARKIFFRLGFWNLTSYLVLYRRNPIREVFRLLDAMRLHVAGEYQDTISYKGHLLPQSFCDLQRGKISTHECLQRVYAFCAEALSDGYFVSKRQEECVRHFMTIMFAPAEVTQFFELDESLYAFLQKLKLSGNYRCYLFSNIDMEAFACIQKRFSKELSLFDGVVTSYQTGYLKPEQEMYDVLYQMYNITPQNALYLDDQYDNIQTAQMHGVHAIHYKKISDINAAKKKYL